MSWSPDKASAKELQALVELSRRQTVPYRRSELQAGLDVVTARLDVARARERRLRRVAPLVLVVIVGVALVLGRPWSAREPTLLAYTVQGGTLLEGGYLREVDGAGIRLQFEEGTQFRLAPGARARLRSVSEKGARLGLESGAASVDVTPDPEHRWEIEVGPFLVQVKGTTFQLTWDPRAEQFRLDLEHGRVLVSGPVSNGELTLHAGQRLAVDLARGETRITERRSPDAAESAAVPPPSAELERSDPSKAAAGPLAPPAESHVTSAVKRDWANDMARGRWDKILQQAELAGISTIHATASAEDLFTLANAARYRKRTQLARESLLVLQRRFATSARAVDALFLLGRLDESRAEPVGAKVWFDKYLERAPQGTYAGEALGRKMTLVKRLQGADEARPIAERYLRQFPNGTYAHSARVLLEAH